MRAKPAATTIALLLALVVLNAACGSGDSSGSSDRLNVVATTTMLGDVVANIVGDDGTVEVLLAVGADPHEYRASAMQVTAIITADLVVANGLGFEEGLENVLNTAAQDGANIFLVAEALDPIRTATGREDPHVWLDPARMADGARLIAAELSIVEGSIDWAARAEIYARELLAADDDITTLLATVPEANRQLITGHDELGYFAQRYGFEIVGHIIPGTSTLADPNSADLARMVETIEEHNVRAVFVGTSEATALADALVGEVESQVAVVPLFTGSLGGPNSGAETLIEMLITNATRIADALSAN